MMRSYAYLATNAELKEILARRITPLMEKAGYTCDGQYTWFSPWEGHSRQVVRVYLLKGASAMFQWGRCFDFLPVPSGSWTAIRYQRTDRSVGMQLFTWPEGHWTRNPRRTGYFSQFGADLRDVERQVWTAFQEARPAWEAWFRETAGLEASLREAERQSAETFNINWPRPQYVRAFLLAALGRQAEGAEALEAYFCMEAAQDGTGISPEIREKLRKKLLSCKLPG